MDFNKLKLFTVLLIIVLASTAVFAQSSEPVTTAEVIPDILYVRSGPGSNFDIIGELKVFTRVDVFARNDPVTWVFVKSGDLTGWVSTAYLRFPDGFNVAARVPIFNTEVPASTGQTSQTTTPGTTTTGQQPASVSIPAGGMNAVTKVAANFRRGPGLQHGIITTLSANTSVAVIGRNSAGTWFKVVVNGQEGWLFGELLTINGNRSDLPVVDGTPTTTTGTTPGTTTGTTGGVVPGTTGATGVTPSTTTSTTTQPTTGRYNNVIVGVGPGGNKEFDGRLNPTVQLGNAIIYCVNANGYTDRGMQGGGIAILHHSGPSQGVVFFASEAEINAVGIPQGVQLIKAESGYYLYRRFDRLFELRAINVDGQHSFTFYWLDCNPGPATPTS